MAETWLLNEQPQWIGISSRDFSIQFTSNNQSFTLFRFNRSGDNQYDLQYNDVVVNGGTWNNSLNSPNWTGWANSAYRTVTFETAPTGDLLTWLQANGTKQSNKLSVDLTTLSGWSNLAPGNHTIKIVSKGTGYRDSEKSAGVEVTKPAPVYTDCLTFTGESSEFTLKATNKEWDGTLQWSTDHNTWTTLTGTEEMQSVAKKLYLRGKGNTNFFRKDYYGVRWVLSAKAGCSGNIQTLLDWENPPTSINIVTCYANMFYGCTNLTSAPELPATTLAAQCYEHTFHSCTNLTTAPELPATTLSNSCYKSMFQDCTNLTTAPKKLPATTLERSCYISMFQGCVNLTTAPELPATTLAGSCYSAMFYDCTKLKINTSSGNKIFTCPSSDNVYNMFTNTGGSFTGTPTAGNTYYWTE